MKVPSVAGTFSLKAFGLISALIVEAACQRLCGTEGVNILLKVLSPKEGHQHTCICQLVLLWDQGKLAKELLMADKLIICTSPPQTGESEKQWARACSRFGERGPPAPQCHKHMP